MRADYIILSSDRVAFGFRVKPERAAELVDKYAPSAILPDAWQSHPVARISAPVPVVTTLQS